jgi:protein-disulfide isomerase
MKAKLAIGAGMAGAAILGAFAVAYSNAEGGRSDAPDVSSVPTTAAFDGAEEAAIRAIVKDYLIEHPEVLVEALTAYDRKQMAEAESRAKAAAVKNIASLVSAEHGFVAGADAAQAKVAVIEFFDYHCGYCKRAVDFVRGLTRSDPAVKVVFRDFPILRQESEFAAKAALAARRQGKYADFHFALMEATGLLDRDRVLSIAAAKGLDVKKLEADMGGQDVARTIADTQRLATELAIDGTPAFVIATADGKFVEIVSGARQDDVKDAIAAAKKAAKG